MSLFAVVTPAGDRSLLTQAEAREAIGDASADVTNLIARVSAAIVLECNVRSAAATPPTLRSEVVSDTYRLKSGAEVLVLSRRPVTAIGSVVEDGVTLTASDYELDAAAGLLRRLSDDEEVCWPACKIVVTYTAGWSTVPSDLAMAAMKLAAALYSETGRDPSLKRESVPGLGEREFWVSQGDDPLIPLEVKEALAPYRNIVIG